MTRIAAFKSLEQPVNADAFLQCSDGKNLFEQFSPPSNFFAHYGNSQSARNVSTNMVSTVSSHTLPPPGQTYPLTFSETFLYSGNRGRKRIFNDFANFYEKDTLCQYGIALIGGGILANTRMDYRFKNWYQRQIRCDFTDDLSGFSKVFGEGKIFIPVAVTTACVYRFYQEKYDRTHIERPIGNFFDRTARGYAVGTPTLLLGQLILGGDRPRNGSSYWKPFCGENHTFSGHAFIGAIPFITAAHMSERIWVKGVFYTLSVIPAWSRVNDNAHFLSQSLLGWYLAYLSVRSVSETEGLKPLPKGISFFPVVDGEYVGLGFAYRR